MNFKVIQNQQSSAASMLPLKRSYCRFSKCFSPTSFKSSVLLDFPSGLCRGAEIQECKSRQADDGFPTITKVDLQQCWQLKILSLGRLLILPCLCDLSVFMILQNTVVTLKIQHYTVSFFCACSIGTENDILFYAGQQMSPAMITSPRQVRFVSGFALQS